MLVFSAIFFTLGYVMGRSQYDGQVRAASTQHDVPDAVVKKSDSGLKHAINAMRRRPQSGSRRIESQFRLGVL